MRIVAVPNDLRDAIYAALDRKGAADIPEADREALYKQLLAYYDEHGHIPDFTIERMEPHDD